VWNGQIFTTPLSEGCVAGVMRQHLLQQFPLWGYTVVEQAADIQTIAGADAIFLTNAIRGIRWVKDCAPHQHYTRGFVADIHGELLRSA
jgi:branched-chain amino acid aminotransferase